MKALKICVGIVLAAVILVAVLAGVLLSVLAKRPAVPEDYTATVETGGPLEERYLAMGGHDVSYFESGAMMSFKKYEIHYPSDIASMDLSLIHILEGRGPIYSGIVVWRVPVRRVPRDCHIHPEHDIA